MLVPKIFNHTSTISAASICNDTTWGQMKQDMNISQVNITSVVYSCRDVCTVLYGSGNPDISGIGVTIAYLLQIWITGFTGIVLPLAFLMYRKSFQRINPDKLRILKHTVCNAHGIVTSTNVYLAFSIAAATLYELRHGPYLFEASFLNTLNIVQFVLVAVSAISLALVLHFLHPDPNSIRAHSALAPMAVGLTLEGLYFGLLTKTGTVSDSLPIYEAVISACAEHWDFPRYQLRLDDPDTGNQKPQKTDWRLFGEVIGGLIGGPFVIYVFTCFVIWCFTTTAAYLSTPTVNAIIQCIKGHLRRCDILLRSVLRPVWDCLTTTWKFSLTKILRPTGNILLLGLRSAHAALTTPTWKRIQKFTVFVVLCLALHSWWAAFTTYLLLKNRHTMQMNSPKTYQDNEWGFGQIFAVLSWAPLFGEFVKVGIDLGSSIIRAPSNAATSVQTSLPKGSVAQPVPAVGTQKQEELAPKEVESSVNGALAPAHLRA